MTRIGDGVSVTAIAGVVAVANELTGLHAPDRITLFAPVAAAVRAPVSGSRPAPSSTPRRNVPLRSGKLNACDPELPPKLVPMAA
jgi:hypothetical protein